MFQERLEESTAYPKSERKKKMMKKELQKWPILDLIKTTIYTKT